MKKVFLTATTIIVALLVTAQAQKGIKPKNSEIKDPPLTTIPMEAKGTPVVKPEDEIKEMLKQLNALKVSADGLVLQGVTENGKLVYLATGGKKISLNSLTGEMEVAQSAARVKPIKIPPPGPGPYNPYPKGPYLLMGISPDGQIVNSASDGTMLVVNPTNGELSKTTKEPRKGCVLRPKPVVLN